MSSNQRFYRFGENSMIKKTLLMIKKYSLMVLAAAIIAVGVFYVINNPSFFTASVLSLQEKAFITQKWRDIAYKTTSGYLDIFISENLETPQNIDFTVSFDKDTVNINAQNISGQWTRTVNNPDDNSITIQSIPGANMDKSQSIILLPFTWESKNILLSEAGAKFSDGKEKSLSIGSLNEITVHGK